MLHANRRSPPLPRPSPPSRATTSSPPKPPPAIKPSLHRDEQQRGWERWSGGFGDGTCVSSCELPPPPKLPPAIKPSMHTNKGTAGRRQWGWCSRAGVGCHAGCLQRRRRRCRGGLLSSDCASFAPAQRTWRTACTAEPALCRGLPLPSPRQTRLARWSSAALCCSSAAPCSHALGTGRGLRRGRGVAGQLCGWVATSNCRFNAGVGRWVLRKARSPSAARA